MLLKWNPELTAPWCVELEIQKKFSCRDLGIKGDIEVESEIMALPEPPWVSQFGGMEHR